MSNHPFIITFLRLFFIFTPNSKPILNKSSIHFFCVHEHHSGGQESYLLCSTCNNIEFINLLLCMLSFLTFYYVNSLFYSGLRMTLQVWKESYMVLIPIKPSTLPVYLPPLLHVAQDSLSLFVFCSDLDKLASIQYLLTTLLIFFFSK